MKAHQDFITWLLTVPRERIFSYVFSKFGVNNKLRTNKSNLDYILQERGGRLTCREDKRCAVSFLAQVTNSVFRLVGHVLSLFCPAAYFGLCSKRAWEAIWFGGMKVPKYSGAGALILLMYLPPSLSKANLCTKLLAVHKVTNKYPSRTWRSKIQTWSIRFTYDVSMQ